MRAVLGEEPSCSVPYARCSSCNQGNFVAQQHHGFAGSELFFANFNGAEFPA